MAVKVTIIGGGSSMFVPDLLRRLLKAPCMVGGTLSLMDIDEKRLAVMDSLGRRLVDAEQADLKIESTVNQREALRAADFVIVAISVGGMAAWEQDIEIPARYGVFMHIADSIGPGGIMRALRNGPVLAGVARDVSEVAPGAWILNYTNPASAMTMALNSVPGVNAVSLCSCTWMPSHAEWMADRVGVAPEEIETPPLVAGLNHCAGIVELKLGDGRDGLALAREHVAEPVERWALETYGILPYCWAHWTEFYPQLQRLEGTYEGRAQGLAMSYGRRIYVMDEQRARAQQWAALADRWTSDDPGEEVSLAALPHGPEDEGIEVVDVLQALAENRNQMFVVNTANRGAIDNVAADMVVEVQAVVGGHGICPVRTGAVPEAFAAHMSLHAAVQRLTAEAALSGDERTAMQAFLHDPLLMARLDLDQTKALFKEIMEANRALLPQF